MAMVTVIGTVEKVFFDGRGIALAETFTTKDGHTKQARYTAWFEQAPGLNVGDVGQFSGLLSTVIEDWTNPDGTAKLDNQGNPGRSVKVSLNRARYTADKSAAAAAPAPIPGWDTPAVDDGAPF